MSWDIFGTERENLRRKISELLNEKHNIEYENRKLTERMSAILKELNNLEYYKNLSEKYKCDNELSLRAYDTLQYRFQNLKKEFSELQASYNSLKDRDLLTENTELGKAISDFKNIIDKKDKELKELQSKSTSLEIEIAKSDELKKQLEKYRDAVKKQNEIIRKLTNIKSSLEAEIETTKENLDYALSCKDQKIIDVESELKDEQTRLSFVESTVNAISRLPYARIPDDFLDSILSGRLQKALDSTGISIVGNINMLARIKSDSTDEVYYTTLYKCTCSDYRNRKIVCKHMLYLAYSSGLMLLNKELLSDFSIANIKKLNYKIQEEKTVASEAKKQREQSKKTQRDIVKLVSRLQNELDQSYPWLASMYKRFQIEQDNHDAYLLSHRSKKSNDIVKKLKKSNQILKYENALLQNQMLVYESLFPWLEEFKKIDIPSAVQYVNATQSDEEYDRVSDYLSPAEYKSLSTIKKNQLALDRYKNHRKSDWEIGVDYERYIGYLYEKQGYKVKYSGATERLKDMGRDLICINDSEILIIQCKRWSEHKTIHEKHIFQLFGSTVQYQHENPQNTYIPVFVTTTKLSDIAKYCANILNIQIIECKKYEDYPCIKCNISKTGEKIYHLPFDQQYDSIVIEKDKGEFYANTVEEAESQGFRRAYKWHGQ